MMALDRIKTARQRTQGGPISRVNGKSNEVILHQTSSTGMMGLGIAFFLE